MMEGNIQKGKSAGSSNRILIPVDFSPKGNLAVKVGFELARRLEDEVTLLHASVMPDPLATPQFPDDFYGIDNENSEIEEMELNEEVHDLDTLRMEKLKNEILAGQRGGEIPEVNFDTAIAPGMPEEVIAEYCAVTPPHVVVMATRGCDRRREELIGSVTAEVIDHCRASVFTVPEDYTFAGFKQIVRICTFCHLDGTDEEAVRKLMTMFSNPSVKIYLFPATDKYKGEDLRKKLEELKATLQSEFPASEFIDADGIEGKNLREEAENLFAKESIQMILVPNRKRNAIARFFNPGLAHKILYEIDFPLLAIPV